MRAVHGTMMDPAVVRRADAALPRMDAVAAPQAPVVFAALARGAAFQSTMGQWAARRTLQAVHAGTALPRLAFDADALQEAVALGAAVSEQCLSLQSQWLTGLTELAVEMSQLRQTHTVAKYLNQEMNLVQQGIALVTTQATATVRLAENIQNNLAWWLSRRGGSPG